MGSARVLLWDACPLALPELLTVARARMTPVGSCHAPFRGIPSDGLGVLRTRNLGYPKQRENGMSLLVGTDMVGTDIPVISLGIFFIFIII